MRRRYTENERKEFAELYFAGKSVKNICAENDVTKSALYNWISLYTEVKHRNGKTLSLRKLHLLEKHMEYLKRQCDVFLESGCSISTPLAEKLEAISRLKDRFNVHVLCDTLKVRRSTFYHYLLRRPAETQNAKQDAVLKPMIREIFDQSKQRFGSKKIRVKLLERGIRVSAKRICRLMKEMDLVCAAPTIKRNYRKWNSRQYMKNKLNREFTQTMPNQAWVSDITYVKSQGQKYYVCTVMDLCSRKVLSYNVAKDMTTSFVSSAFQQAFIRRGCPKALMFHSDQGRQYTSVAFQHMLNEYGVTQSLSKPGCPYDNAVAESFYNSMKKEELKRSQYETVNELRFAVEDYIHFYNEERPHQSLSYLTPAQKEKLAPV